MMNSLTANLHLMMATFYRPTKSRNKILIERHAFPSDRYAVVSQINWHGYSPGESLVEAAPDPGHALIATEHVCEQIDRHRNELALVLLPGVQYYTGQVLDIRAITCKAHEHGIAVGFDLAHAAGNVTLDLHDWDVDFAVWCTYKYLNSGPGSVGGSFVHRRHAGNTDLIRLAGWWGHDKRTRFEMPSNFVPMATAEGWQLSNPPILSLAAIRASLEVFQAAGGMQALREKSVRLTGLLFDLLLERLGDRVAILTPGDPKWRGCQLSLTVALDGVDGQQVHQKLEAAGVRTDWRNPNVIRAAPVPLYNSYSDVYRFVEILESCMNANATT
jgi:kynureninase